LRKIGYASGTRCALTTITWRNYMLRNQKHYTDELVLLTTLLSQNKRLRSFHIRVRPIRRSEIGKIGTHQKIGESDMCTVRFRFACGRHAACQINWCIHNSTAHGEHLAATVTRARCRKQTGGEGVRGGSAVGQPTSLIFASYRWSFDVYSRRVCTAMDSYIIGAII